MIEVSGLEKTFGRRTVVKNVTFTVEQGEVFGLLGPNGAGKTTTLRMLSTSMRPTRGTARVAGYDVVRESEQVRARLGVLPTDPGLYGRLTAAENLRFYGRLCGLGGAELERRIDELLEWLGLADFKNERTEHFSKGMRQKVALARAVLHAPQVLILDEPTAGLDVLAARSIIEFIRQSKASGRSVLFSSHYLLEADVCDRRIIVTRNLHHGHAGGSVPGSGRRQPEDAFAYCGNAGRRKGRRAGSKEAGSRVV